jgi:hypothetical protein
MARGVREGCTAVRALGLRVAPLALRVLFTWLPPTFAIYYWRRFFASKMADYISGRHARVPLHRRCANSRTIVAPCWKRAVSRLPRSAGSTVQSMLMRRRRLGSRSSKLSEARQ